MLHREIIAVCSEIHTKHINTLCGQNVELLNVKLVVHIVTTGLWRVNMNCIWRSSPYCAVNTLRIGYKNQSVQEIIAVCSDIHTEHMNTLCGQNEELLEVKRCGTNSNH